MTTPINELETPCVLIDLDRVEANLKHAQAEADRLGLKLRPHIKTHKLPRFAKRQVELGAVGITVQKLGEAEVMAEAGLNDIFLPYNILGAHKLGRLKALNERVTLAVTADSPDTVAGYATAFTEGKPLTVLIECDTGMGRCGVQTPAQALALAAVLRAADRPDEAVRYLDQAMPSLARIGGSHAQRDLFDQIRLAALTAAGRWAEVQQALELRRAREPDGVSLNRQLAYAYEALGLPAQAAEAGRRGG